MKGRNEFPSLDEVRKIVPSECFQLQDYKSVLNLGRDALLVLIFSSIILYFDNWWLAIVPSICLGLTISALFFLAHEAVHRTLFKSHKLNTFFGYLLSTVTLYPYKLWRDAHMAHHESTHVIGKDFDWSPLTIDEFSRLTRFQKVALQMSPTILSPF